MIVKTKKYNREGFLGLETPVTKAWLQMQSIPPNSANSRWFDLFPYLGGSMAVEESDIEFVRIATLDDLENVEKSAKENVLKLFGY